MEEGGGPSNQQRAPPTRGRGMEWETPTRLHAAPARSQEMEEGGGPPTQQHAPPAHSQGIEGDTPTRQRDPPARSQGIEEGGEPPEQQRALLAHGLQEREEGDPLTMRGRGGYPLSSNDHYLRKACRRVGEGEPLTNRASPP